MDYYEGIVERYLSCDRETFISPQFYLNGVSGTFWIDALAISPRKRMIYMCEVTFSKSLSKIMGKTAIYISDIDRVKSDICEISGLSSDWGIRPWLFLLREPAIAFAKRWVGDLKPKITYLENTAPWMTPNGFRTGEPGKPYVDLPVEFQ